VHLLYGNLPTALFATVAIVAILGYVQWSVVHHGVLVAWVASIFVISLGRYLLVLAYEHACPPAADARRWGRWFTLGTALSALPGVRPASCFFPTTSRIKSLSSSSSRACRRGRGLLRLDARGAHLSCSGARPVDRTPAARRQQHQ
jgi:hypothetical protein